MAASDPNPRTNFITPAEMFTQEPTPFDDEYARRCFRVLRMVSVLHGKGFHGLRVLPHIYPLAYRIVLYPAEYTSRNGVSYVHELYDDTLERQNLIARHTGANEANYFGWQDASKLNAQKLAILFLERFPELARATYHLDYPYVGWYATLMAHCEYGYLPYLFAEYEPEMGVMRMKRVKETTSVHDLDWFPLPPSPSYGQRLDPRPEPRWMQQT